MQGALQGLAVGVQLAQHDLEAVTAVGAPVQLAPVTARLQRDQARRPGEVRVRFAGQMQAEPLAGHGAAVLETAVAHGKTVDAGLFGQPQGHVLGVPVGFFDLQPEVLALAFRDHVHDLGDAEILEAGAQQRFTEGAAVGGGRGRQRRRQVGVAAHWSSWVSSTTACTAMPSPRPVNPSRSVVVAFTDT